MNKLSSLLKRPPEDVTLVLPTLFLVWAIRIGLWVLPFATLRKIVTKAARAKVAREPGADGQTGANSEPRLSILRLKWAVQVASRYVPQATCLTQALTMQILMGRRGHEAIVHIGVAKGNAEKFEAHAWLESHGKVIIGGAGVKRWTRLTTLEVNGS